MQKVFILPTVGGVVFSPLCWVLGFALGDEVAAQPFTRHGFSPPSQVGHFFKILASKFLPHFKRTESREESGLSVDATVALLKKRHNEFACFHGNPY
jgi:hypothetical protein